MANRSDLALGALAALGAGGLLFAHAALQKARKFEFRGKVVLVTGGSRGLGLVLCRLLAREGCKLAICARDKDDLEEARRDLEAMGGEVLAIQCDLRNRAEVEAMVGQAEGHYRRIDLLINNAGTLMVSPLEHLKVEDFEDAMATNFWAAVYASFAALPGMRKRGVGRITNISSIGGKIAVPHLLPYSASKFALTGFSRGLRSELYKDGIVVTTICPGLMRTGSPRNVDFKGQKEAEYAWFSISDSMPLLSMDVEQAASDIMEATRQGDAEGVLGAPAKIGALLDALTPELSGDLFAIAARLLPKAVPGGDQVKKGHESESKLSPSLLTRSTEAAAVQNNEV